MVIGASYMLQTVPLFAKSGEQLIDSTKRGWIATKETVAVITEQLKGTVSRDFLALFFHLTAAPFPVRHA